MCDRDYLNYKCCRYLRWYCDISIKYMKSLRKLCTLILLINIILWWEIFSKNFVENIYHIINYFDVIEDIIKKSYSLFRLKIYTTITYIIWIKNIKCELHYES